ncbi:hypothetical protein PGT21_019579 [Puccinia graminis f. sp. tritici]|uniref:Uncharacterized protein n=1 Tax=Puccinia graminis f. sp. tritici TaxID=56615 RepID=A0A5B0QFR9_PUCGR|nr:hypothetical protein PGT21_019579 [Puccinia graminis f. sp. tritici]
MYKVIGKVFTLLLLLGVIRATPASSLKALKTRGRCYNNELCSNPRYTNDPTRAKTCC